MPPAARGIPAHWPVLGVCGFSGSGKTTLIESLVPTLRRRGLAVAVLKHDAHGMRVDTPGKDTDRFFAAGATVVGRDPGQAFLRRPAGEMETLPGWLELLLDEHDLVIVEGHKNTPLPARIWLERQAGEEIPPDAGSFDLVLPRGEGRLDSLSGLLAQWLPEQQMARPLRAGLLVGGRSRRMGRAKSKLLYHDRTWAELAAEALTAHTDGPILLGQGLVPDALASTPRLPDVPGHQGPLGGMLAALRWDRQADWIFAACDMPLLTAEALGWLLSHREPGRWAVVPRRPESGALEPLAAWYDARMLRILEQSDRPVAAADHPRVYRPELPREWSAAWRSFNAPEDLTDLK